MDPRADAGVTLKELHDDLGRKYRMHGATIENAWRSFDRDQRARCMKAGAADGVVLQHRQDWSTGNGEACKIIPEWNLYDISESGPDFLLDLLKHRATRSLFQQYCEGVNGSLGDHEFIDEMMRTRYLRHANPVEGCYIMFADDVEKYAISYEIVAEKDQALAQVAPLIRAGIYLPQSTGGLIVMRQTYLLGSLNVIIEDILEEGSQSRIREEPPRKSDKAVAEGLSKLSIQPLPAKLALADLVASARDHKDSLKEYLGLLSTEPAVLAHTVNVWFFSRPELVHDEKGRSLPVHTDRYISAAILDATHNAVKTAATWGYIDRLLVLLESSTANKVYRAIVLQELSNVCHLEYGCAQALFKRYVQTGTGSKRYRRVSNAYDKAGNARVAMKGNPEDLTRADPQLHYLLRLCQAETNACKAVDWIKKLGDLYERCPLERERLRESEAEALGDLVVVTGFIQDLSLAVPMPSLSRKKGQIFVSRSQELEAELNQLKKQIDLRDFAVPIDNLLEPGMAEGALKTLDQFFVEKAGTKLGSLYQDLVEDCLSDIQNQYQYAKARMEQKDKIEWVPISAFPSEPPGKRVETRKQKEKTRPSHSSVYDIARYTELAIAGEPSEPTRTFKVAASTAEVFSTLFTHSESRGSIRWEAFEAAMADLGFSVLPKFGSVYTFLPPDSMAAEKSITLHRPHRSRIEGHILHIFARRLKGAYGWSDGTFKVG